MVMLDHVAGVPVPKPVHAHKERKPLLKQNRKRAAKRYADNFGKRGDFVRAMPCLLLRTGRCAGLIEAAHAKARGMGGVNSDRRSLVPLCRWHHRKSHRIGAKTFAELYTINLSAEADRIARELDARGLP